MLSEQQVQFYRQKYGIQDPKQETRIQRLRFAAGVGAPETRRPETGKLDQFITGAGKGVISTFEGTSSLGERIIRGVLKTALPKGAERALGIEGEMERTAAEEFIPEELRTPQTRAEKAGFFTEQIGEFFIPISKVSKARKVPGFLAKSKKALQEGLEFGAKTALQTGGEREEVIKGAALGTVGGAIGEFVLGPGLKTLFPKISKELEKVNLRLTPTQKRRAERAIDSTVDLVERKNIVGTPEARVAKVKDLYVKAEDDIQKFLTEEAKDRTVPKQNIIDELESLKAKYSNERDAIAIEKQIDGFKNLIESKYDDLIPVSTLNDLKRSTYKNAYNKAGDKVLDFVEHDAGDILRRNIINATDDLAIDGKSLSQFNREYGQIIEARKLLETAASRKQVGLIGKLMALGMGGSIGAPGGPVGSAAGIAASSFVAEQLAGTLTRSFTAKVLREISKLPAQEIPLVMMRILVPIINKTLEDQQEQE